MLAALQQQVTQAKQHIKSLERRLAQLRNAAHLRRAAGQARLGAGPAQPGDKPVAHAPSRQSPANQVSTRLSATQMAKGSKVLDPATPIPHSHYKIAILYAVGGRSRVSR